MTRCIDFSRHEHGAFGCPHRGYGPAEKRRLERWTTVDGCTGECCMECFFELGVNAWPDLWRIAMLDPDGIPWASECWTEGDRAIHIERTLRRLHDIQDLRSLRGQPPWLY